MNVFLNKKGMTLVEVLMATVITLVIFLALMQSALLSIEMNTKNALRDEAVAIAEARMREARSLTFTDTVDNLQSDGADSNLSTANCPTSFVSNFGTNGLLIERNLRRISSFDFCTNMSVTSITTGGVVDNKQVDITVEWIWNNKPYSHSISTIVRKQQ